MNKDMTQGNSLKLIVTFFIPVLIGNLFQQFYNMADTIIVGKLLGVKALAAVGSTGSLLFLVLGFAIGLCNGFGIPIAHFFGARDMHNVRRCILNSLVLTLVITAVMTAAAVFSTDWLLTVMQTPADIYSDAHGYLVIMFAGIGATMFYNLLACIARALGDVRTPLYFLIFSSILNIGLDIAFIQLFHLGTAGAAYATVLSQIVAAIVCAVYMVKKFPELHMKQGEWALDAGILKRLFFTGLPMALQFSITAVGSIVIQVAVNSFGSGIVAAITAAQKLQMFFTQPFETMGITMATYCGQNMGAKKMRRVKTGILQANVIVLVYSVIAFAILNLFGRELAMLFIRKDEIEILPFIEQFMLYNTMFFPGLGLLLVLRNGIQGLGFTVPAMASGAVEMVARCIVALVFVKRFGFMALCMSNPAAWTAAAVLLIGMSVFIWKRKLKKFREEEDMKIAMEQMECREPAVCHS